MLMELPVLVEQVEQATRDDEGNRWIEASDIALPPGTWPLYLKVVYPDGHARMFGALGRLPCGGMRYCAPDSALEINVIND